MKNGTKLSSRQWELYNYLVKCFEQNERRWISPEEICKNVNGYYWNDKAYDHCKSIRNDKKYINSQIEIDKLIVMSNRFFKIGTKEEVIEEIKKHERRLIAQAKEISNFRKKCKLDGQFKLLDNRGNEMTDYSKLYRETFSQK